MDWTTLEQNLWARTPGLMDATGKYAVLVPLVEGEEGPALLYEVRAGSLRRQPGEVCFPGGKMEAAEYPEECALRETWEELGHSPPKASRSGGGWTSSPTGRLHHVPHSGQGGRRAVDRMAPNPAEVRETFQSPSAS